MDHINEEIDILSMDGGPRFGDFTNLITFPTLNVFGLLFVGFATTIPTYSILNGGIILYSETSIKLYWPPPVYKSKEMDKRRYEA